MNTEDDIHEQFEEFPYPGRPIEQPINKHPKFLYGNCISNSFYARDRKLIYSKGMKILDAGCGTGAGTLELAVANPDACVTGIDWSKNSLEVAKKRCSYHGITNVDFKNCSISEISTLEQKFDFISCRDTLYLVPEPSQVLQTMRESLSQGGIIRADLHNARQRYKNHRAQELFTLLGVMSKYSNKDAVDFARTLYESLNDRVFLKSITWNSKNHKSDEIILSNHLLRGDKSFTLREVFTLLQEAGLQLISMVDSIRWDLDALFKTGQCEITRVLDSIKSKEDYFLIYDLLNYNSRLYDFWCCSSDTKTKSRVEFDEQTAAIHLHPVLRANEVRQDFEKMILERRELVLGKYIPLIGQNYRLTTQVTACLYPLLNGPLNIKALAERWQILFPLCPKTLKPVDLIECQQIVKNMVLELERLGALFIIEPDN